jgi:hypothetical protein
MPPSRPGDGEEAAEDGARRNSDSSRSEALEPLSKAAPADQAWAFTA